MLDKRTIHYGIPLAALFLLLIGYDVKQSGRMVVAPATLDGVVTVETSSDKRFTFITCTPLHPPLWRRLTHSLLSGAFVAQPGKPTGDVFAHTGTAHIEYLGNVIDIVFADSTRFLFSTEPRGYMPPSEGKAEYSTGIATYSIFGLNTQADFVGSQDWTQRSCGI